MILFLYPQTNPIFSQLTQSPKAKEILRPLQEHHQESYEHCLRVGELSIDLALENTLAQPYIEAAGYAGIFHDVGKTDMPLGCLDKPGPLDEEERAILCGHPRQSYRRLLPHPEFGLARRVLVAHHEFQSRPYPRKGGDRRQTPREGYDRRETDPGILTLAQILAAADVFDALSMRRAYKEPFSREKIEEIFRQEYKGNPQFVEQVMRRYHQ